MPTCFISLSCFFFQVLRCQFVKQREKITLRITLNWFFCTFQHFSCKFALHLRSRSFLFITAGTKRGKNIMDSTDSHDCNCVRFLVPTYSSNAKAEHKVGPRVEVRMVFTWKPNSCERLKFMSIRGEPESIQKIVISSMKSSTDR